MQALKLKGSDVYSGLYFATSKDFGKSWGKFSKSATVKRFSNPNATQSMLIDASPFFHKKSGKFIIVGANLTYKGDKFVPPHRAAFSVFNESAGEWTKPEIIALPDNEKNFASVSAGSAQVWEESDGSILLPVSCQGDGLKSACVIKCVFDGKKLSYVGRGNFLSVPQPRGLYEPSIIKCNNSYFLSLRNDITGYLAKSRDGLHFSKPVALCFDDGSNVGNYNTQTHFIESGARLFLVYTRRGANNDHVFRHRAPLFAAEVERETPALKKATEIAIVPERGARLGNFGCTRIDGDRWAVVAAEWMQSDKGWKQCVEHGSDNSIFFSEFSLLGNR